MLTRDKIENHINALIHKHEELEKRLEKEFLPEYISHVLKKEKLLLKDEIESHTRKMELL
jgi:uncharacterized protein YdcH (DUF465 family)